MPSERTPRRTRNTREKITKRDISIERTIGGYWRCSTVANGERVTAAYNGYTKREALSDFLREVN